MDNFFDQHALNFCNDPRPEFEDIPEVNWPEEEPVPIQPVQPQPETQTITDQGIINPLNELFYMFEHDQDGIIEAEDIRLSFS